MRAAVKPAGAFAFYDQGSMKQPPDSIEKNFPPTTQLRVVIEQVRPEIDHGLFPIKRSVGEEVTVTSELFTDGHDVITAVLLYKEGWADRWKEMKMVPVGNDLWQAAFTVFGRGDHFYTVEAWIDHFRSWRQDLVKRIKAGQEVSSELLEGAALITAAMKRAAALVDREWLREWAQRLSADAPQEERVAAALDERLSAMMASHPDRSRATRYDKVLAVRVERDRARVGAWYEMFPRSAGPDPTRSATFREAALRLPEIAAMGFDVLYLPPIHPIGKSHRKGRNNALTAGPNDPGSPWAIGSEEGGHKSIDPGLGTLADFKYFVAQAHALRMEIALDLAFQCSPDHPYVKEHPEWFRHRPDGTIKYAENPPKKYQDIYPFNFECDEWRALWLELKSVVLYWIAQGVWIFRVDNPHTKPIRFWQWLIQEVQREHPDVIFLAEAFSRPAVMYGLAKIGFTQSYTYFTWRNTKWELIHYMTELTGTEVGEYFRPNLFANTPDILHEYLQVGGRAAFQIRLVLAATLGATYGIYSGFELCEAGAVPGTEEYLDSEKYQIRAWDWNRPGHIKEWVTRVNQIRRANPALHFNRTLRFCTIHNDQLICYLKSTSDGSNLILVAVNLDPHQPQEGWVQLPLWEWGMKDDEPYQVHDLLNNARYVWQGEWNYIRLDPAISPAHIFKIRRKIRTEKDFDYFL
jgi:starch synthase (maltosyl-transferring)